MERGERSKKWYVMAIILMILILAVAGMTLYLRSGNKISLTNKLKISTPTPARLSNLEISKNILAWMSKQKNPNSVYFFGCDYIKITKTCVPKTIDNRVGVFALWARYQYYKITNLPEDRTIIDQDLRTISEPNYILQTSSWSCRLMKDLWSENVLNDNEKQMAKDICNKTDYESIIQPENNIKHSNEELINAILTSKKIEIGGNFENDILYKYLFFPSEFAAKGSILEEVEMIFNRTLQIYILQAKGNEDIFQLGFESVNLYSSTQNKKYLDLATFAADNYKCTTLKGCVFQLMLEKEIYKTSKNQKYKNNFDNLLSSTINNYFDNKAYTGYADGMDIFWTTKPSTDLGASYDTRENALLVDILLRANE